MGILGHIMRVDVAIALIVWMIIIFLIGYHKASKVDQAKDIGFSMIVLGSVPGSLGFWILFVLFIQKVISICQSF